MRGLMSIVVLLFVVLLLLLIFWSVAITASNILLAWQCFAFVVASLQ